MRGIEGGRGRIEGSRGQGRDRERDRGRGGIERDRGGRGGIERGIEEGRQARDRERGIGEIEACSVNKKNLNAQIQLCGVFMSTVKQS